MIPPVLRRCPHCGHVGRASRFTVRGVAGDRSVECPVCHGRFAPTDRPWLA